MWGAGIRTDVAINGKELIVYKETHTFRVNWVSARLQDHWIGKEQSLQQMGWDNSVTPCKRMTLDPYFTPYTN